VNRSPSSRLPLRELALGALVTLALAYSTMFQAISVPNERSRIYLAVALVDHGSFQINQPIKRFGWILDVAEFDGKVYSDKAPGSSLLAAFAYGGLRIVYDADAFDIGELIQLMRRGVMLPLGIIGFFALRRLLRRLGIMPGISDVVSLGWILGSAAFHYSTAFYGHQIVGVAFVLALLWIERAETTVDTGRLRPAALALLGGAAAGFAGLTEYQAGIPALLLALYVVAGPLTRHVWGLIAFIAGALPFLLGLLAYNTIAFGGPLQLSYHHLLSSSLESIHSQGIGGVTTPSYSAFHGGLLSLHRGLFTSSPMFLLALPGFVALWREGRRRLAILLGTTFAFYVLFISSSNMWVAGWSFGPRLLVAGMGLIAIAVASAAQRWQKHAPVEAFLRGTVVAGILYNQLIHAFFPEPPPDAANPLLDVVGVLYTTNLVSPNLVSSATHSQGVKTLLPLCALLAVALGVVMFRRLRARRLPFRALVVASLCVPPTLLVLYARHQGPSTSPAGRQRFASFVTDLAAQEAHVAHIGAQAARPPPARRDRAPKPKPKP
jgi:hypothetical protein